MVHNLAFTEVILHTEADEQTILNQLLRLRFRNNDKTIGVGSGAAGAALAAPIFCLVAVLGPRFFPIRKLFVL